MVHLTKEAEKVQYSHMTVSDVWSPSTATRPTCVVIDRRRNIRNNTTEISGERGAACALTRMYAGATSSRIYLVLVLCLFCFPSRAFINHMNIHAQIKIGVCTPSSAGDMKHCRAKPGKLRLLYPPPGISAEGDESEKGIVFDRLADARALHIFIRSGSAPHFTAHVCQTYTKHIKNIKHTRAQAGCLRSLWCWKRIR